MSNDANEPSPKIVIDEDWKTQVERERAESREAATADASTARHEAGAGEPLPPPTLTFLASTLFLQGAVALGLLPNPANDAVSENRELARHCIDMLAMLQAKTEGNRTDDESRELETMLHQLRMAFVTKSS